MTEAAIRWGQHLPPRGQEVARLLSGIANVTLELRQRKGDAERLGEIIGVTPHFAWQLAMAAAVALGYGPHTREGYWQIVKHGLPGGEPPAEVWLRAAGLEEDGTWQNP